MKDILLIFIELDLTFLGKDICLLYGVFNIVNLKYYPGFMNYFYITNSDLIVYVVYIKPFTHINVTV